MYHTWSHGNIPSPSPPAPRKATANLELAQSRGSLAADLATELSEASRRTGAYAASAHDAVPPGHPWGRENGGTMMMSNVDISLSTIITHH